MSMISYKTFFKTVNGQRNPRRFPPHAWTVKPHFSALTVKGTIMWPNLLIARQLIRFKD